MIFISERTKAGAAESMMHHATEMGPCARIRLTVMDSGAEDIGMHCAEPGRSLTVNALSALLPSHTG